MDVHPGAAEWPKRATTLRQGECEYRSSGHLAPQGGVRARVIDKSIKLKPPASHHRFISTNRSTYTKDRSNSNQYLIYNPCGKRREEFHFYDLFRDRSLPRFLERV